MPIIGAPNPVEVVATVAASGAAQAITNPAVGATITVITLTANCTLTFPSAGAGKSFTLVLKQDATGSRLVTWPTLTWPGGVAPTLTTTAAKTDVFSFLCVDGATWYAFTAAQGL
jgi:hypothetical protein